MDITYKHRNFGLDLIRAVAILLVLLSHATLLLFPNQETFTLYILRFFGTIGVDLFFVLSGYLIGGILLKQLDAGATSFKAFCHFWTRRWFRTLPNYFLILVVNIVLLLFFYSPVEELWLYFLFIQNFTTAQPDFFTESWSLSIEEYAYVLGPFLLFLMVSVFKRTQKKQLFLWMSIITIMGVTFLKFKFHQSHPEITNEAWSKYFRKVVIYRLDSIYYGFLAIFLIEKFKPFVLKYKALLFGFGFLLFFGMHLVIFVYDFRPSNASLFFNLFYLGLISISLLLTFPYIKTIKPNPLIGKIIIKISILSYAIYLINYSIVLLTIQYFITVSEINTFYKFLVLFTYLSVSFGLSYLLYTYFENPMTKIRDSRWVKSWFE